MRLPLQDGLHVSGGNQRDAVDFRGDEAQHGPVGSKKLHDVNEVRVRADHEERCPFPRRLQRYQPRILGDEREGFGLPRKIVLKFALTCLLVFDTLFLR